MAHYGRGSYRGGFNNGSYGRGGFNNSNRGGFQNHGGHQQQGGFQSRGGHQARGGFNHRGGYQQNTRGGAYNNFTPQQALSGEMLTNQRPTVDHHTAIVHDLEERMFRKGPFDRQPLQPSAIFAREILPPVALPYDHANGIATKYFNEVTAKKQQAVRGDAAYDSGKSKSPAYCLKFHPTGRRLISGHGTGDLALWYACTYNFENISSVHSAGVRCLTWSHNEDWLLSGDDNGVLNYLQANMNTVAQVHAHAGALLGVSFSPTDVKFCTASADKTLKVFDFYTLQPELELRGHGADVCCVAWHPHQALLVSGSKDSHQTMRLWDPKANESLAKLELHKDAVLDLKWHDNGNWLLSAGRDSLIKLFDLRAMKEIQTFRAHSKEVNVVKWHPVHDNMFASGGSDGAVNFWMAGTESTVGSLPQAHGFNVWDMDWHPLGHVLVTSAGDCKLKMWTRHQPGETMTESVHNASEVQQAALFEELPDFTETTAQEPTLPGMEPAPTRRSLSEPMVGDAVIPGLD
eukprot:TRINITY_DN197_c0_g1_i1.p1 TRINITY_DN197_c0_g1~~TRINITY_DN197_c0_g1_i1.p1  ORF type:complete len:518 (+),score=130.15 TRINITY_DN197_c0_g1_i1:131-1684(+)